jgi:membrane protein DedA with SNARE-associated domain/diacylglycerol kinase family enzyme
MQPPAAHRSQPSALLAAGAALTAAAVSGLVVAGVVPLPDFDRVLEDASTSLGGWAYPAVAGFALLETGAFVGLLVPGETAVVVGGVVAAAGDVDLVPLIGLVWLAATTGDVVSFLLGRRLGRPFLDRHGPRLRLGPDRVAHVQRFYDRHGGKAVLLGRFAGLVRAVSPFLAGASGFALRRFLPWSAAGALAWAAAFTLIGYAFSESFSQSGEAAARIALAAVALAALAYATVALLRGRSGRPGRARTDEPGRGQRTQGAQGRAERGAGHHVEREVNPEIDAGERHGGGDRERGRPQPRAEDGHRRGGGEGGRAVPGWEGRIVGDPRERAELRVGDGRALAREAILQDAGHQRGRPGRSRGRGEGDRDAPAPDIRAQSEPHQQGTLDPPGRQQDEDAGQPRVLDGRSSVDQRAIEVEQWSHGRDHAQGSKARRLLVVVNGRASGVDEPERMARDLAAVLQELGADAEATVTANEEELWDALRSAAAAGRRAVLVGGDGTLHSAANAPLSRLPEVALVPAGRANNIARALGIPTSRSGALAVASQAPARPLDALRVATPDRLEYALEAVSGGFQAEARAGYTADNSSDLRQGVRALLRALRRYHPYTAALRLGGRRLRSTSAAQVFFSNLPYFGFGFEVDPGADPSDGRFETIVLEARGRGRLLWLLGAARRGRHIGKPGVLRFAATRAQLTEPLPLVADAVPLGNTTATVTVEPARLRVASPGPRALAT